MNQFKLKFSGKATLTFLPNKTFSSDASDDYYFENSVTVFQNCMTCRRDNLAILRHLQKMSAA